MDFDKLRAPFPADRISWRVGSTNKEKTKGMALAYIDARDVMDRLDAVCGPAGWQNTYPHANGKTVCTISVKCGDEWISKSNGAGDSDVEAEKGALSDAFKRAAVQWGIGRYLYDVESPWVEIEPMGKSYKIKETEYRRLRRVLSGQPVEPEPKAPEPPTAQPRPVPKPADGWYPLTANAFAKEFLEIAVKLPKDKRQEHYKINEATIADLRLVSAKAAENIDNRFAEIL